MKIITVAICMLTFFSPLWAHGIADHWHINAFLDGLLHPLTGIDHLLMLIAAGLLIAHTHYAKRTQYLYSAFLIALLMIGVGIGQWILPNQYLEYFIMASLIVSGLALWLTKAHAFFLSMLPILLLGHGIVHGTEAPVSEFALFSTGLLFSSISVLGLSVMTGQRLAHLKHFAPMAGLGVCLSAILLPLW